MVIRAWSSMAAGSWAAEPPAISSPPCWRRASCKVFTWFSSEAMRSSAASARAPKEETRRQRVRPKRRIRSGSGGLLLLVFVHDFELGIDDIAVGLLRGPGLGVGGGLGSGIGARGTGAGGGL